MFTKILVANRGEIARRVCRTCREMGISTVAVFSPVDSGAPHVLAADEAVALADDDPARSYLDQEQIISAAQETGAQAIHPGYGFLSENGDFAQACLEAGLTFIGPPAQVLRQVGDKLQARKLAHSASVAVTPGTMEPSDDLAQLESQAQDMGYPIMLKAAAGGGGKGMRRVEGQPDLAQALQLASSEAQTAFGDGRLFMEKYIADPRHVEVQLLADDQGQVVHLFERECSIQRRHQKIIEEAPSPALDEETRTKMCQAAVAVARAANYRNAGTVEFLLAPDGTFYFMEVNARLQVEHPVTEAISGIDLVRQQILLAAGQPLAFTQEQITLRGHALECRIYAEDPAQDFMPSPGEILALDEPSGPGVRFDCGVRAGGTVPVQYDPILAKLTTWAEDRQLARRRMARALSETAILGVQTPIELLLDIVACEPFAQGLTHTGFLEEHFSNWCSAPDRTEALLLAWAAAHLEGLDRTALAGSAGSSTAMESATQTSDPWHTLGRFRMED